MSDPGKGVKLCRDEHIRSNRMRRVLFLLMIVAVVAVVGSPARALEVQRIEVSMQPLSQALPDLFLRGISLDDQVVVREPVNVDFVVANAGASLPVSVTSVTVSFDYEVGQKFVEIACLNTDEEISGRITLTFLTARLYDMRVSVDPENVIEETSTQNNTFVQTVNVLSERRRSMGCPCDKK